MPVGPVISTQELLADKTLYDGNTLVNINQGGEIGEFTTVGVPFTFSNFQPEYGPCPTLGGNNEEILTALGYTKEQQEAMAKNSISATSIPLRLLIISVSFIHMGVFGS